MKMIYFTIVKMPNCLIISFFNPGHKNASPKLKENKNENKSESHTGALFMAKKLKSLE